MRIEQLRTEFCDGLARALLRVLCDDSVNFFATHLRTLLLEDLFSKPYYTAAELLTKSAFETTTVKELQLTYPPTPEFVGHESVYRVTFRLPVGCGLEKRNNNLDSYFNNSFWRALLTSVGKWKYIDNSCTISGGVVSFMVYLSSDTDSGLELRYAPYNPSSGNELYTGRLRTIRQEAAENIPLHASSRQPGADITYPQLLACVPGFGISRTDPVYHNVITTGGVHYVVDFYGIQLPDSFDQDQTPAGIFVMYGHTDVMVFFINEKDEVVHFPVVGIRQDHCGPTIFKLGNIADLHHDCQNSDYSVKYDWSNGGWYNLVFGKTETLEDFVVIEIDRFGIQDQNERLRAAIESTRGVFKKVQINTKV